MKKYRVTCYPNFENFECEVEADNIKDAINEAEDMASMNCCFIATESDVEEIEE